MAYRIIVYGSYGMGSAALQELAECHFDILKMRNSCLTNHCLLDVPALNKAQQVITTSQEQQHG